MSSSSKRQQTMAKRNREQAVREKRELKLQKKHAAAAARNAEAAEPPEMPEVPAGATLLERVAARDAQLAAAAAEPAADEETPGD